MKTTTSILKIFMLMLLFAASQSTFAISPSSDCGTSGSQQISVNTNSCNTTSFDFSSSIGSPSLTGTCANGGTRDGWGWFTATGTSTTVSCDPSGSDARNVALMVYSGTCGSLTLVACVNNDASGTGTEVATFTTTNGANYFIRVVRMSGTSGDADNDVCVTNNVVPIVTGFSPSAGCVGSLITINGTGLSSASSVKIGGTTASIQSNSSTVITATVGNGTTGTVSVTTAGGTGTSAGTFTVNPLPVQYTVSGGGAYCSGGAGMPVNLSNSELGVDYQLKLGAGNVGAPLAGTGAGLAFGNQTAAGTYTVVATNAATTCGRTMSGSAVVTINAATSISTQPVDKTACESTNTNVSLVAAGASLTYQWQDNSSGGFANISGATNATYNLTGVTLAMDGRQYMCNVNGACGSATSNIVTLTVNPKPIGFATPTTQTVCEGVAITSIDLDVSNGLLGTTYGWTRNNTGTVSGMSSSGSGDPIAGTLNSSSSSPATTTFTITPTSSLGCAGSTFTSAVIVNPSTVISTNPAAQTKCEGTNASYSVSAQGVSLSYQWQDNSSGSFVDISGATTNSLSVNGVTVAMNGWQYRCVVTGTCGVLTSNTALLTVNPVPTASISPATSTICGSSQLLTSSTSVSTPTYQWKLNGNNISGATNATYNVNGVNGSYTVVITKNSCSATSAATALTFYAPPVATVTPGTSTVCSGVNRLLAAAPQPASNLTPISENFNGVSTITVVNGSGNTSACAWTSRTSPYTASSTTFNSGDNKFMLANSDAGGSGSTTNTTLVSATFSTAGYSTLSLSFKQFYQSYGSDVTVAVEVSTNGGSSWTSAASYIGVNQGTSTAFVTSNVNLNAYINQANFKFRFNYVSSYGWFWAIDNVVLSGTPGVYQYSWSANTGSGVNGLPAGAGSYSSANDSITVNATATTNYTMSVMDMTTGCVSTAASALTVNPLPNVTITPNGATAFCEGNNVTLSAPAGLSSYSWNTIPVQTSQSIVVNTAASYTVVGTNASGCSNNATQAITVYDTLPASITVIGSTNLCTGQATTTDLQATQANAVSYVWSTTEPTSLITVGTAGTYSVTAIDNHGCEHHQSQVITETPAPAAPIVVAMSSTILCSDGITTSTVVLHTTNYSADLLWSTSENTTDITVDYADIFTVTYTDANGCFASSNSIATEVREYSVDPVTATNSAAYNEICIGSPVQLTVNGGTLASDANWVWYEGNCASGLPVATGMNVSVTPSGGGTHTYYVRAEGFCNVTNCVNGSVLVRTSPPNSTVQAVTAPASACTGNSGALSVNTVSNATFYSWSGPAGVLFNGNAGPFQTLVPNVTSTFGSLPGGSSGYSMCVFAGNACGQSNTKCTWVRGAVSTPGVISGSSTGCPNASYTYSVSPVAGADLYTWFVTGNDASLNGTGLTSVTSSSPNVVVDFAAPFVGATLNVYASLSCGYNSAVRSMTIVRNPALPGAISGLSYVCPNGSTNYSVPAANGAVSYNWSCTVPGVVITPSGTNASILFPAIVPPGSAVCVASVSACGYSSGQRCKGIASGLPNTPANISGPSSGQCGATGVSFAIPPISNATTYQWNVSNGNATIVGPNNLSGVTVDFSGNFTSVQLSVSSGNACGSGGVRTLTISGNPNTPVSISGNNSVCNGSVESYTTTGSAGASSLNWQVPAGAMILGGQGTSNVLVLWGSTSGNVRVTASNNCGNSGTRTYPVSVTCRESQMQNTIESEVKVFPNPAHDKMKVEIGASTSDRVNIQLINAIGEVVYTSEMNLQEGTNMMELNLENVAKGFYQLSVKGSTISTQHRVVVQ